MTTTGNNHHCQLVGPIGLKLNIEECAEIYTLMVKNYHLLASSTSPHADQQHKAQKVTKRPPKKKMKKIYLSSTDADAKSGKRLKFFSYKAVSSNI